MAVHVRRRNRLGKPGWIHPEQVAQLGVPPQPADVEEHRPRGVRVVGDVATGELEDEPGVDRAEDRAARRFDVPLKPFDLRAREIRVDHEPRSLPHQRFVPGGPQLVAALCRAAVLPDKRAMDGLARLGVPGHDRFALVRDPDRVQVGALDPRVHDRLDAEPSRHLPDLARVVLDPAGLRKVLLELRVRPSGNPALAVEDEAGGPGGALVDGEDQRAPKPSQRPAQMRDAQVRPRLASSPAAR